MNAITQEYASDLSDGSYKPTIEQHGVGDVIADVLSRRSEPQHAANWRIPFQLMNAKRCIVPPRDAI